MATKRKKALEARKRGWRTLRNARLKLKTPKQIAAMDALEDRWERERKRIRKRGYYKPLSATCKIHRLVFVTQELDLDSLKNIPGFVPATRRRHLSKLSRYRVADSIRGTGSIREIVVEHSPRSWGSSYRVTIRPKDGLLPNDLFMILELAPDYKLAIVEVAWDFPADTIFDVQYALRHMLCGKMPLPVGENPFHQKFGVFNGGITVRLYTRFNTFVTRLELQLQRRFFRDQKIESVFDFHKLPGILLPRRVWFGQLDEERVVHHLRKRGLGKKSVAASLSNSKTRMTAWGSSCGI